MKRTLLVIIVVAFMIKMNAQNSEKTYGDSLVMKSMVELNSNQLEKSLSYAIDATKWQEKEFGKDSKQYDFALSNLAFVYFQMGRYKESISIREEQLVRYNKTYGAESSEYASILDMLSSCYMMQKDYSQAIEYGEKTVSAYERIKGKNSQEYNMSIKSLSMAYAQSGEYMKAIACIMRLKEWIIRTSGKNSVEYGEQLTNLCNYYTELEEYKAAMENGAQAIDILEPLDDGSNKYASYVYYMATMCVTTLFYKQNDLDGLLIVKEREKNHYLNIYGEESVNLEMVLTELSSIYMLLGKKEAELNITLEQKEICEKNDKESLKYASILRRLASIYSQLERHDDALESISKAVQIVEGKSGKNSQEYADILKHQALLTMLAKKYDESKLIAMKAMKLKEQLIDTTSPDYIKNLFEIAKEYASYDQYHDAIRIMRNLLPAMKEKDDDYATAVETFADYNYYAEDFVSCIDLIREALKIREVNKNEKYVKTLMRLSHVEERLGNYSEAIDVDEQVLEILNSLPSDTAKQWRMSILTSLAGTYSSLGNRRKAGLLKKEAMELEVELNGIQFPDIVWKDVENDINDGEELSYTKEGQEFLLQTSLEGLAELESYGKTQTQDYGNMFVSLAFDYILMNNYTTALEKAEQGKRILEKAIGKNNTDFIFTLETIAECQRKLGRVDETIKDLEEALYIAKSLYPENHPDILSIEVRLANAEATRSYANATQYAVEATYGLRTLVKKNFAQLTNVERNLYWEKFKNWFLNDMLCIAKEAPTDDMLKTAYDGLLLSKGLLLNSEIEVRKLITESDDKDLLNQYYILRNTRAKINDLKVEERHIADSLENVIDRVEKGLLRQSKKYGDYTKNLTINWEDVRNHLKADEVAVEFVKVKDRESACNNYAALLLRHEDIKPIWVNLFGDKELKKPKTGSYYSSPQLSQMIWKPLSEYLSKKKTVYFAPDGELYNIAIESLPHWSEDCLISDKWNMYRLSSTRQIAIIKDNYNLKQASVYGGIKYDTKEDLLIADSKKYQSKERSFNYEPLALADSLNLRSGASYLPATKTEAEEISKALEQKNIITSLKLDSLATEGSFRNLSGKKMNLLHIATHGFYWTEKEAMLRDYILDNNLLPHFVEDKALTRSGLLLAGANYALMGKKLPEGVDDGILTAKEISQLDLRGLDLVVLSACQTGLGELLGDGVFGLQRGFKKAGAKSLLMSLWKVDDEATHLLMTQFYKNLTSGMSKYESLKQAQRYVKEYEMEVEVKSDTHPSVSAHAKEQAKQKLVKEKTMKKVRKYQDPYYWAAFILLDALD